uniref:Uncharacterized protein n=1 Tax=Asterionellopsis glacialis TaxID=33640 RepID=A0A7S0PX64_9STRA
MINSWNDWEEDTQMEPVITVSDSDVVSIFQPSSLTQNLIYNSYGELFLDIVRSTTWERDVIIPEEPPLPFPEYNGPLTVGVYYYPWHGDGEFHGREYLRGELEPPQEPLLGEYDDRDPAVVGQHLAWSRGARVNLWVTSWWGPNDRTDITTRDVIMKHEDLPGTKIALFYETMRLARGATEDEKFKLDAVYPEFKYMAETYFGSEHYYKIDGRPVVYVYLARVLHREGFLETFIDLAKQAAMENGGYDLYVVGDFAFKYPSYDSYGGFDSLDAVTNYDMYGSLDRPRFVGEEGVETYKSSQNAWRAAAKSHGGCDFVPALGPGYNDRGVRLQRGHKAMSRKLSADKPDGSLFSTLLPNAFNLADSDTGGMVMINSWNEWHEDSQIEPVVDFGNTTEPSELTQNLAYPAYGSQYLDILRNAVEVFEGKNI